MSLVKIENLTKTYGSYNAVNNITFTISEGRCMSLLGPNGAGKTTTLQMLAGLIQPNTGNIVFPGLEGQDIRKFIGYLPQYPSFYSWMTAEEFLTYIGRLSGLNKATIKQRIPELLEMVGLGNVNKKRIGGFSGGMKQRLGLAQALIHNPKLLILDEPVSALDPIGRRDVLEMMKTIKKETTIFFSTHVLHDAEEISDDILIIQSGEIKAAGSIEEIKATYQKPMLYIQTKEPLGDWLSSIPHIYRVHRQKENEATLAVSNIEEAKLAILETILSRNLSLQKFEEMQDSLEDLFMKVVGK
ncbi:ABC transporter ATP-binding protein [Bacillus sp. 165]|uniref:ABC transporter ATP-binding protein n=1 Tax=Bacillus sp. 165 TaxID=1529117 RepID=UPI001ADA18A2|nr:ABC transporter ATP-binding protein [Bacillus sp. 165]MBO9129164.1 ABC transporter ATP-binding protein [Bacillus sp. 165]